MLPTSSLVVAAGARRSPGRLDWPGGAPDPTVAAVAAAVARAPAPAWLGGGEPTLRRDLPVLVQAVAAATAQAERAGVGLDTDGLALGSPRVAAGLKALGVTRVRIALHSGRSDAHDWLVGTPGAAKRARRAITLCAEAGLPVTVLAVVTRPTSDFLEELVHVVARLGAGALELQRLACRGPAAADFIALSPRLGLAEPSLQAAAVAAADLGLGLALRGFPRCAAPRLGPEAFGFEPVVVPADPALAALGRALAPVAGLPGCPSCPGDGSCAGAPADYVAVFGRGEVDSERPEPPGLPTPRPPRAGVRPAPPPPRRGRAPATRVRFVRRQVGFADLGGDPMAGEVPDPPAGAATLAFAGTSRHIRQAMARLSQEGIETLVLAGEGVFAHPAAGSLLRDALRLSLPRVEARGDVRPLAALSDREVVGLRGLARLEATTPPGADPAEIDAVLARFARLGRIETARLEAGAAGCEDAPSEGA